MESRQRQQRALDMLLTALGVLAALVLASRGVVTDVGIYHRYAVGFLTTGGFPREYPPLALVPMLLAQALAVLLHTAYARAWLLLSAVVLYILARAVGRPALLLALLPLASPLLGTYDIWPILCLVLSYRLLPRRPALSWLLLGLAIALKLFPLLFVPLWWQQSRRGWGYALLPLLTFYPPAMASVVHYQFARQAEWESTVSLISWLIGAPHLVLRHAFGSVELYSRLSGQIGLVLDGLYVLLFVWLAFLRRELPLLRRMLLLLSLWFLTNKVLSAQYVFWVVCLAYADGLDLLWFAALAWATSLLYPWLSLVTQPLTRLLALPEAQGTQILLAMWAVALRLAIWLVILARLWLPPRRAAARRQAQAATGSQL
jgi:hypothetical protein